MMDFLMEQFVTYSSYYNEYASIYFVFLQMT
jgi:hypothetical protein